MMLVGTYRRNPEERFFGRSVMHLFLRKTTIMGKPQRLYEMVCKASEVEKIAGTILGLGGAIASRHWLIEISETGVPQSRTGLHWKWGDLHIHELKPETNFMQFAFLIDCDEEIHTHLHKTFSLHLDAKYRLTWIENHRRSLTTWFPETAGQQAHIQLDHTQADVLDELRKASSPKGLGLAIMMLKFWKREGETKLGRPKSDDLIEELLMQATGARLEQQRDIAPAEDPLAYLPFMFPLMVLLTCREEKEKFPVIQWKLLGDFIREFQNKQ